MYKRQGYNIGLFYNSFRRFFCQVYDVEKTPYSVTTDIVGEKWSHLCMTYSNENILKFYLNGNLVDTVEMKEEILQLSSNEVFVGASNGEKTNKEFFYGLISNIEIYDIALSHDEVKEINENPTKIKLRNFGNFKSSEFIYSQVQPQLASTDEVIDIGGEYNVTLNNVKIEKYKQSFKTFLPKPLRRNSKFKSLEHKTNSSVGNKWVHDITRKNQIKYYNEVRQDIVDSNIDGLNTCRYNEISKSTNKLVTKISIEL